MKKPFINYRKDFNLLEYVAKENGLSIETADMLLSDWKLNHNGQTFHEYLQEMKAELMMDKYPEFSLFHNNKNA